MTNIQKLDLEVLEAKREMDRTHTIWMDTNIWAPEAAQVRKDKDAACNRYSAALTSRGQAGGRAYPTWSEASPLPATA